MTQEVKQLATQRIDLAWRTVASNWDMREFQHYNIVTEYKATDHRHQLFLDIKLGLHKLFEGPWGAELLRWSQDTPLEFYGTEKEAKRIEAWIRDNLYERVYRD